MQTIEQLTAMFAEHGLTATTVYRWGMVFVEITDDLGQLRAVYRPVGFGDGLKWKAVDVDDYLASGPPAAVPANAAARPLGVMP